MRRSLIILLANMILNPGHNSIHVDQHLAVKAIDLFDKLIKIIDDDTFHALRTVVGELSQKAETAVTKYRQELRSMGRDIFEALNVDGDPVPQEVDYLPANNVFDGLDGPFAGLDAAVDFDVLNFDQGVGNDINFLDGGMLDMGFMR
ncbi:hypothetical protein NW762_013271 [Fusarium torreyae]|uniref:Uncharacterized protein n=1 Tax=Fusarium torreyae TaxID=1237075 RepID=A0A9W8V8U1_9HYPO|nr:hypothetical protein NW762_013271 [Fusarium torreyae]